MNYLIKAPLVPARISIRLPASKSISNRVLILNALGYGPNNIENLSESDDVKRMLEALNSDGNHFDVGAAGTTMRFLTAFLSKVVGEWTITGSERMKNRPIKILVDALNSLGARIEYMEKEGYPPLRIYGSALQGGEVTLDGSVSSQYISALLMVAPLMERGLVIHLDGFITSRPYIHLTLALMASFGVQADWQGQTIRIAPQEYRPVSYRVESDWSAASYWYQIMALSRGAKIELRGLYKNSLQGDSSVVELFSQLGVGTAYTRQGVVLKPNGTICRKMIHDFSDDPDLAQTLIVTCVCMDIPFRFSGLHTLRIKETDRLEALKTELKKLGYMLIDTRESILEWHGERCQPKPDPLIATYEDHRMAMAFAPIALTRPEGLRIADPGVVSKSYPGYWADLKAAGFRIESSTEDNEA